MWFRVGDEAAETRERILAVAERYEQYGPLKADTAQAVIALLEPIQARYHELMADPGEVQAVAAKGAAKARALAAPTLERARERLGLLPR